MNVFNELAKLQQRVNAELKNAREGSDEEASLYERAELLDKIVAYRDSYSWLYKNTSKERIKVYIESGYDYQALCDAFNIDYENASATVVWASKQFRKRIGEKTLQYIREGYINEAEGLFLVSMGKAQV